MNRNTHFAYIALMLAIAISFTAALHLAKIGHKDALYSIQAAHNAQVRRADSLQKTVNAQRWAMFDTAKHLSDYGVFLSFCALSQLAQRYNLNHDLEAIPCHLYADDLLPDSLKGHNADPYAGN